MKVFILFAILISSNIHCQSFEKNEKLKNYKSVNEYYFSSGKKSQYHTKYNLENGRIQSIESYRKSTLTRKVIYLHDNENVKFEITTYDFNVGKLHDTITFTYTYNANKQLIEKRASYGMIEQYSNFNEQNLPEKIIRPTKFDSITGYKEILTYNSTGKLIQQTISSMLEKVENIEINQYKYDDVGNMIETKRAYSPNLEFPIIMTGGRALHELERFRYVYNEKGLWTEQYITINGKEFLLERRKFK